MESLLVVKRLLVILLILAIKEHWVTSFNIQSKLPIMLKPLTKQIDLEHPINFGVSLAILKAKQNQTVLLVGAPSADLGDQFERPGQIFNCNLNDVQDRRANSSDKETDKETGRENQTNTDQVDCKPIKISSLTKGNNRPIAINDFMQLGGSMSSLSNGKFTICAPGALNLYYADHYPNGQCWTGNYSTALSSPMAGQPSVRSSPAEVQLNSLFSINPLNDTKRQIYENTYFYSHGEFGFSSKVSKVCVHGE